MSRPDWVWKDQKVQEQLRVVNAHEGYELWNCGVQCPEAASYDAEQRLLGRLLDTAFAAGEPAVEAALVESAEKRGEILIQHRLSNGSMLDGCVFTASHMLDGRPMLRGSLCIRERWRRYVPFSFVADDMSDGMIRRPIRAPLGWTAVRNDREIHVVGAPSKSDAMRTMRIGAHAALADFVEKYIEPRLRTVREAAATKAAEAAVLAAWEVS